MKKSLKIVLCVLLVILLVLAGIAYKNRNSIEAFFDALRYSQEDIDRRLEKDKADLQKYIDEKGGIIVREPTQEELEALETGTITEDELAEKITAPKEPKPEEPPTATPAPTPTATETPQNSEADQAVSAAIAKLYVQKNKYLGKLNAVEAHVRGLYKAMTPEEKKGAKQRLLNQYLSQVAAWENECDAAVYSILAEVREAVQKSGQDESIVDKLESAYLNEKKAKKAYFINRYMD